MALRSIADYIGYMMDRFGESDAAGLPDRARCLNWLQWSEDELWSGHGWWFRQIEESVAMTAGTDLYTTAAVTHELVSVRVGNSAPLAYLPPTLFRETCSASVAGTPRFWTQVAGNSSGNARFQVWPVPDANGTIHVVYHSVPTTLADSGSSYSGFPLPYRGLVLYKALARGLDHYNLGAARDLALREFEQLYGALLQEDQQREKVRR